MSSTRRGQSVYYTADPRPSPLPPPSRSESNRLLPSYKPRLMYRKGFFCPPFLRVLFALLVSVRKDYPLHKACGGRELNGHSTDPLFHTSLRYPTTVESTKARVVKETPPWETHTIPPGAPGAAARASRGRTADRGGRFDPLVCRRRRRHSERCLFPRFGIGGRSIGRAAEPRSAQTR